MEDIEAFKDEEGSEEKKRENLVRLTLIRSGIKCDHSGFTYLVHAINQAIANPALLGNFRELFSLVAKICGAKDFFRVEANIHNTITHTYKTRGFDFINQIYEMQVLKPDHKPTTAEFIRLMVEYYRLELYKKEGMFE